VIIVMASIPGDYTPSWYPKSTADEWVIAFNRQQFLNYDYIWFLFKNISPYFWCSTGIALCVGLSIAGAAWYDPFLLRKDGYICMCHTFMMADFATLLP
jgi:hypothetical protein